MIKMLEKINFEKTNWDAIQKGHDQYKWIMNNLDNQNEEFRKKFAAFYKINLGLKQCEDQLFFFNLLSLCISSKNDDYADVLKLLSEKTGRNEMSFTSKIVATVNPQMPIIDKIICGHLKISRPRYAALARRKTKSVDIFKEIKNIYKAFLNTPKGEMLLKTFNEKIIQDNFNTTDIKKLDFMLWQNRK